MDEREMLRQRVKELLRELSGLDGVSGHEHSVVARLSELLHPYAQELSVDTYGNIFARVNDEGGGPSLMVAAHSDEIGALVKSVEPNGMIRFERVGGVIETLLI